MKWEEVLALARRANPHYSLSEDEQEMVWKLALTIPKDGLIVELGVCWGKTAVILAAAAQETRSLYYGIDNWSLEGNKTVVWDLLTETLGDDKKWWLFESDTHSKEWEGVGGVDFLLIDAGHDPVNVTADCAIWIPQVRPGGIVLFDDVPSGPGWETSAHWAVRRMVDTWCADWENAASWGKLWGKRRPLNAPQA